MACRTCGLVLDHRLGEDGSEWMHNESADHPAVPVPVDSIDTNFRCDFCLADNARWTLPVGQFMMMPGHENYGDWAACDACAAELRDGRWDQVVTRASDAHEQRHGFTAPREAFEEMYERVRRHMTGQVHLRL